MHEESFEVEYSRAFIRGALPDDCRRIVEIGCGAGELAARLAQDGFTVLALDGDANAVMAARGRGVDARVVVWPAAVTETFDAVLFTRSMHHIHSLAEAVDAAAICLTPRGRIIVEDFALEEVDARTLRWFNSVLRRLSASGELSRKDETLNALLESGGSISAWRSAHDHDLHPASAMKAGLERRVTTLRECRTAYLFRYLADAIEVEARRNDVLRAIERQEREMIAEGAIAAIGWRFVGQAGSDRL